MAADPNPELRASLKTAAGDLDPEIRGLTDLTHVSITPELSTAVNTELARRTRLRTIIQAAIKGLDDTLAALNILEQEGFPDFPPADLTANLLSELHGQGDDIVQAIGVFMQPQAASLQISLGNPADKP